MTALDGAALAQDGLLLQAFAESAGLFVTVVARLAGLAVFAGLVAGLVAFTYRWYVRERVPLALALLVALSGVAVVLNTTQLLAAELAGGGAQVETLDALSHIVAFVASTGGAYGGVRAGDRLGVDVFATRGTAVDVDVSEIVQSVGRVTTVQLPEEIDDVVGYDPVPEATKDTLAGRRFLFPRRLTKADLRERLVSRLKTDYGVGHVDVELADDGTVAYLAVGSRAAGIGPTLPPATNAVAVRADPAHAASAGDLVQVWETDPLQRVLTGELRGAAGDVVTVAIDAADTPKLNPTERYKLVTLPVEDRPDREFASLLRAADETLATVTVEAGSELAGATLEAVDATVAAVTREDAPPDPLPDRTRPLAPGDVVYAIATPDVLRRLEAAAAGTDAEDPVEPSVDDDGTDADAPSAGDASPGDESPTAGAATNGDDAPTPADAPEVHETSDDGEAPAGDTSPADGAAFPDANDLPGLDPEDAASSLSFEESGDVDATNGQDGDAPADDDADEVPETGASDGVADDASEEGAASTATDAGAELPSLDLGDEDPLADPLADEVSDDSFTFDEDPLGEAEPDDGAGVDPTDEARDGDEEAESGDDESGRDRDGGPDRDGAT